MSLILLRRRRFLPLFLAQALGALNDNLFKNAMVVLLVFRMGEAGGAGLAAVAGGVFILPFALFSAVAGQVADRFDKARLIRATKAAEVVLMAGAAWALVDGGVAGLMAVLFGLGAQATAFGPLKYGVLPQLLAEGELLAGNAVIEAGTFGAILAGTILGGLLIGGEGGPWVVGAVGFGLAVLGMVAAWFVPGVAAAAPGLRVGWNVAGETWGLIGMARGDRAVWRAILGISWFWAMGATYLAVFPVLARDVFHGDNRVVTLLLTGFAVGVGAGSMLGSRLLRGAVSLRHVGWAGGGFERVHAGVRRGVPWGVGGGVDDARCDAGEWGGGGGAGLSAGGFGGGGRVLVAAVCDGAAAGGGGGAGADGGGEQRDECGVHGGGGGGDRRAVRGGAGAGRGAGQCFPPRTLLRPASFTPPSGQAVR